jgi:hypothetical protein
MSVVNVKVAELRKQGYSSLEEWLKDENHLYIGRDMSFYVKGAKASKWQNPFPVKKCGLEQSLSLYEEYVQNNSELMASLHELEGKTLGCWCKPGICHGDILLDIKKRSGK